MQTRRLRGPGTLVPPVALVLVATIFGCNGGGGGGTDSPATIGVDQLVFNSSRTTNNEIFRMNSDGSGVVQLTDDDAYENWWPRISPDRTQILFYRAPAGSSEDYGQASLWVMNADGTGVTRLRAQGEDGWTMQGHAEWSPDGERIAMFGSVGAALEIFVTDADGKNPVQFTSRGGVNTDVSWSPDGNQLLFNGCPSTPCVAADYEIYVMPATALSPATRLTNDGLADYDPYFSPDGSQIAYLSHVNPAGFAWSIVIADADGGHARYLINDGNINSKPCWGRDGDTLYFHRMDLGGELRFGVFFIRSDGTGLTRLTPVGSGDNEYPAN